MAYALFWTVTTQLPDVRAVVPFGEDPYDLFASVAIVLLPLVGGLTALRVVRYGRSGIPDGSVAARVELGLASCLGLVSAAVGASAIALVQAPLEASSGIARLVVPGLAITAVTTLAGWLALGRARHVAPRSQAEGAFRSTASTGDPEPDTAQHQRRVPAKDAEPHHANVNFDVTYQHSAGERMTIRQRLSSVSAWSDGAHNFSNDSHKSNGSRLSAN